MDGLAVRLNPILYKSSAKTQSEGKGLDNLFPSEVMTDSYAVILLGYVSSSYRSPRFDFFISGKFCSINPSCKEEVSVGSGL